MVRIGHASRPQVAPVAAEPATARRATQAVGQPSCRLIRTRTSRTGMMLEAAQGKTIGQVPSGVLREAEGQLARLLSSIPHDGCVVSPRIEAGDAAATTVRLATEDKHDLIVMGTHGRSGIAILLGSVAHRVIACAPCPVTTVRS